MVTARRAALALLRRLGGHRHRAFSPLRCSCKGSSAGRCARCATIPIAAVSFGINPYYYKTLAFGWSAVLAGVAGAFFAIATAFVSPDTFSFALSLTLLIGAVLGGILTFWGALVGALVIEFLPLVAATRRRRWDRASCTALRSSS